MKRIAGFSLGLIIMLSMACCEQDDGGGTGPGKDTTPPFVTSFSPSDGETGVQISSDITATFSESMDESTINETTCILNKGIVELSCAISYDDSTRTVTIDPNEDMDYNETYTVTIKSGCSDLALNGLDPEKSWNFTTQLSNTGSIGGRVTDSYLGDGIPGATVVVGWKLAGTDADGYYMISDVPLGPQTVTAYHQLYTAGNAQTTVSQGDTSTVDFSLTTTEVYEPNDSFEEAYTITSGDKHTCYIRLPSDGDYFSVHADMDDEIIVFMDYVPDLGSPDLVLRMYDPAQTEKQEWHFDDPGPYLVSLVAEMTGEYYLYFDGYGEDYYDIMLPYVFTVIVASSATGTVEGTVYDAYIGNGNVEPVGRPTGADVCISGTGLCDVTTVSGEFTISGVRSGLRMLVASHPLYESISTYVDVPADGTVDLSLSMYTTEIGESNDSFNQAYGISMGKDYTAYIRVGLDVDYFKVYLLTNQKLDINVKKVPLLGTPDLVLRVYNPSHTQELERFLEHSFPVVVSVTAQTDGYYFIYFKGYRPQFYSNTDSYIFSVSVD